MKNILNNNFSITLSNCLLLFAIYYFLLPAPAYGYFDLGTGTYMLQMLLGFGAAIWLSLRTSFIKIGRKTKAASSTGGDATGSSKAEVAGDKAAGAASNEVDLDA